MIINAQLQNSDGGWSTRSYSYYCKIPDIKRGDLVKAPTSGKIVTARVSAVNVPDYSLDPAVLPMLKTITERTTPNHAPAPEASQMGLDELTEQMAGDADPGALVVAKDTIVIEQLPVIAERLHDFKASIEAITAEASGMVCTAETIQVVKARRAVLRRTFDGLEARRKEVKTAVLAPYNAFEDAYKECVAEPFNAADAALKAKIDQVEGVLKDECESRLRLYFDEMCQVHGVDFITYEQANIRVDMTSAKAKTPTRLMNKVAEFVAGIAVGVDQIRKMDDAVEIMAEYKQTLNVGQAVAVVQERRRRVEDEKRAAAAREEARTRQADAVAKVEAVAPPVAVEPPKEDPVIERLTFTVIGARKSQLIKLREYLRSEGMKYE